jgi:hypothetical protein
VTARRPANRNFSDWIDDQIEDARERGEFDNLPGKGKPLKGLEAPHDELWWVKQWLAREGVSHLPVPLALRLEAEKLIDGLGRLSSEQAVRHAIDELNERIRQANRMPAIDGPPTTLMPLDVEELVERWRTARDAVEVERANHTPGATDPPGVDGRLVRARHWWRRR